MILLEGVSKLFPGRETPAIQDVGMEIRDGEILGLVGLNGAGKTTTIRVTAGVALPTKGRVLIDDRDVVLDKAEASKRIGWVPELFPFAPEATARKTLVYYAGFHGLSGAGADRSASEVLGRVGLANLESACVRTFSLGMRRRFSLAAAMLSDPQNYLLDEIMNGLDPEGMGFVRKWCLDLRTRGRCILLSSHLLSELEALADRVAVLHKGRLIRVVDRESLTKSEGKVLHLVVDKPDTSVDRYLSDKGELHVEGRHYTLRNPTVTASDINQELTRRGVLISEMWAENPSLEDYFLNLISGSEDVEGEGH